MFHFVGDSGPQCISRARVEVVSPGGWAVSCMYAQCLYATAAALEDSRKASRKKESITSIAGGIPDAPGCRTTPLRPTPAFMSQQRGHVYNERYYYYFCLSASPTSYSHHCALGHRKQAREPHVMNVFFLQMLPSSHFMSMTKETEKTAATERQQMANCA